MTEKIQSIADLMKLQQAMADQLRRQLASLQMPPSLDGTVKQKTADIELAKDALANAIKERDAVVKYWDDRIALLRAKATRQDEDLTQLEKQFENAESKSTLSTTKADTNTNAETGTKAAHASKKRRTSN